jgi:MraZ protein
MVGGSGLLSHSVGMVMAGQPRYFGLASSAIDAKNRITIPAKFRNRMPADAEGRVTVYVSIGPDFRHLAIFDEVNGNKRIEALSGDDEDLPNDIKRKRQQMLAYMEPVEMDKQGRILLPKSHAAYARLEGEVIIAGAGNHLQVYVEPEAQTAAIPVSIENLDPQAVARIFDSTLTE